MRLVFAGETPDPDGVADFVCILIENCKYEARETIKHS